MTEPAEQVIAELREAAKRREEAEEGRQRAIEGLREVVRRAVEAGVPIARVSREARLSRQQIYNVLSGRPGGRGRG